MIRMVWCIHWSWFTALICLFNQGDLVWGRCSVENVQIKNGTYTLSNDLEEGSILKYQCDKEGFYPYPDMIRICKYNGRWDPPPRKPRCKQVECPDPGVVKNCEVRPYQQKYYHQAQITYKCSEGYSLFGPLNRTCLSSGKWSGPHSVCRRNSGDHCPDPGIPPGGYREGSYFGIGEKVKYTCFDDNMILIGSEERVCQEDRHWSGREPTCYYQHTYDTPEEVSQEFGNGIKNTFASLQEDLDDIQEGRTINLDRNGILNIYIALDISSSIKKTEFEKAKNAVITLIEKIASFSVTPNYEVVLFSSHRIELINILTFFDKKRKPLYESLNELKNYEIQRKDKSGTNLALVFEKFLEKMAVMERNQANFNEHQHVIIVFTDGQHNMGGEPILAVNQIKAKIVKGQEKDRKQFLDIYIFGIGAKIYDNNLQKLTYGIGEKHYFRLRDQTDLRKTFDEIINEEKVVGLCGLHREYGTLRQKYPWAVSITVATPGKKSSCLGSLVSKRFVLTAAHCFTVDDFIDSIKVEVAHKALDVKKLHTHPEYNISAKENQGVKEFYDYDVTLIELKEDVIFTDTQRPICLPCTEETNGALRQILSCKQQEQLLITNYKRVTFLAKGNLAEKSAQLKHGEKRGECIKKALNATGITTKEVSEVVTENFLCSGGTYPEVDKLACKGDSGGAVFDNYLNRTIQLALVSWGSKEMPQCTIGGQVMSDDDSRDFHLNLFKVVPFLKSILGDTEQDYEALVFVD